VGTKRHNFVFSIFLIRFERDQTAKVVLWRRLQRMSKLLRRLGQAGKASKGGHDPPLPPLEDYAASPLLSVRTPPPLRFALRFPHLHSFSFSPPSIFLSLGLTSSFRVYL
jgi:hypothetical protein